MPKIVSDTTPLISLMKISRLEILHKIYSEVIIPKAVYEEIEAGKYKKFHQDLSKIRWIKIENIRDKLSVNYFLDLDAGEAEAIILASEIGTDLIILDEKLGRIHAKHAGIKVTGTIGVLVKAKKNGIDSETETLTKRFERKECMDK
jgi:predicted nucleic acid-binding protein